jgi:hypothetical protein
MQALVETAPPVVTSTSTTYTNSDAAFISFGNSPTSSEFSTTTTSEATMTSEQELAPKSSQFNTNNHQGNQHQGNQLQGNRVTAFPSYSPTYSWPTYSPTLSIGTSFPTTIEPTIMSTPKAPTTSPTDGPRSIGLSIPIDKDATVSESEDIKALGNDPTLAVDGAIDNRLETMLAVNLGFMKAIPDYKTIVLRLFVLEANGDDCGTIQTTLNPWWDESSVTWMNAPGANGEVLGNAIVSEDGQYAELDVTEAFTKLSSESQTQLSVRMFANGDSRCVFSSSKGDALQSPALMITLNAKAVDIPAASDLEEETGDSVVTRPPR